MKKIIKLPLLFLTRIIRLPLDFVFLTLDCLRALVYMVLRLFRGPSACPYCRNWQHQGIFPRPVDAAGKYGNVWVFRLLCPCVKMHASGAEKDEYLDTEEMRATPCCFREDILERRYLNAPLVLLLVAAVWGTLGYGLFFSDTIRARIANFKLPSAKHPAGQITETTDVTQLKEYNPDRAEAHINKAQRLFDEGDHANARLEYLNALKYDLENANVRVGLARCAIKEKQWPRAVQEYRKAIEIDPKLPAAQLELCELYTAAGQHQMVADLLNEHQAAWAGNRRLHLMLAHAYLFLKKPDEARKELEKGLPDDADDPDLLHAGAQIYMGLGKELTAENLLKRALEADEKHLPSRLALANYYRSRGQQEQADAMLKKAKELHPDDLAVDAASAEFEIGAGQVKEGIASYRAVLAKDPDRHEAKARLAELLFATGKEDEAKGLADEMAKSLNRPEAIQGNMLLARIYLNKRFFSDAIYYARQAKEQGANPQLAQLTITQALYLQENYDKAVVAAKTLLEINPDHLVGKLLLAHSQLALGESAAGIETYKEAAQQQPDSTVLLIDLANKIFLTGQFAEAQQYYEEVLQKDPNNVIAINNLAMSLAEQGKDLERAYSLGKQLMDKFPDQPSFKDTTGWTLVQQGKIDEALPLLQMVVEKLPNNSSALYHLATAFYRNNDFEKAKPLLDRALKLAASFPGSGKAAAMLQEINQLPVTPGA